MSLPRGCWNTPSSVIPGAIGPCGIHVYPVPDELSRPAMRSKQREALRVKLESWNVILSRNRIELLIDGPAQDVIRHDEVGGQRRKGRAERLGTVMLEKRV